MSCDGDIMITLTIDGKKIQAEEGQTVLEAAIAAQIYIPSLCYHPNLNPIGSCRLCIVDIEGIKGYPISCHTKVSDGMVVKTKTEELQKLRKNLIWLVLSNYPDDIPVDSQLKKVVEYVGVNSILSKYVASPKKLPILEEEPLFVRDMNKCILCGRCVEMCQQVRGVGAIGLINRGIDTIVGTNYDETLPSAGCKFCRACVEVCPSGALYDKEDFDEEKRKEELLPCQQGCPAGTDIPRYVRYTAEGRFDDAIAVIREKFPFPHTLGMVCHHPCETECSRGDINEPISIREIKRFVAEKDIDQKWKEKLLIAKETGKKIAIVGGGPAGLTAAWFLRLQGHKITVFESLPRPGGMLKAGIPDYRLPPEALEKEINDIEEIGVSIKTNSKVKTTKSLFDQGFDAIFLAMGAPKGFSIGLPGEEDERVLDGISSLKKINFKEPVDISGDVAVVGGGNVAVDIARSSLRMDETSSVTILYRRTREEMPAYEHEIEDALDEGVKISFLVNPVRIIPGKDKIDVECVKMKLGEPDASGRRRPVPIDGSEFTLSLDRLIMAIGQQSDVSDDFGVKLSKRGRVIADEKTLETSEKGVYAGGDLVSGPASVIEAVQMGRVAAASIDRYLGGTGEIDQQLTDHDEPSSYLGREEGFADRKRVDLRKKPVGERFPGFCQVEECMSDDEAVNEADRCLRCQLRLKIDQPPMPPVKKKKKKETS